MLDDDRITCPQCANLAGRNCLAARHGRIPAIRGYEPNRELLRRCEGYEPGSSDPDKRSGLERWPQLLPRPNTEPDQSMKHRRERKK